MVLDFMNDAGASSTRMAQRDWQEEFNCFIMILANSIYSCGPNPPLSSFFPGIYLLMVEIWMESLGSRLNQPLLKLAT